MRLRTDFSGFDGIEPPEIWYRDYYWHIATKFCGVIGLEAVDYEDACWDIEKEIVTKLLKTKPGLQIDEAEEIFHQACYVRDEADMIGCEHENAVAAARAGNLERTVAHLVQAAAIESKHGLALSTEDLRCKLIEE